MGKISSEIKGGQLEKVEGVNKWMMLNCRLEWTVYLWCTRRDNACAVFFTDKLHENKKKKKKKRTSNSGNSDGNNGSNMEEIMAELMAAIKLRSNGCDIS
ncbi:hypothetical protein POVCU1_009850 [Plasmodium ovale curtisi]|uniref:Uncharacterized protein n=1 Tax=Plasmodium ovale curtisi TaxID=864141 RepID=A0A1A8VYV5_PLAOA|nr:hypothetical protein POVCU1_009850 [Plasmodium ovale curtisi]